MIFIFLLFLMLSVALIKLGALSVWVHFLSWALNFALLAIGSLMLMVASLLWRRKSKKLGSNGNDHGLL